MNKKLERRNILIVVILGVLGQIAWGLENSWFNTYTYDAITTETWPIALMNGASAVVATLTTFLIGTVSDRLGKRKPFIRFGYLIWGFFTAAILLGEAMPSVTSAAIMVVIIDCVMTFFGSTAYDACYNAWTTDISDETSRGKITAIVQIAPLVSGVILVGAGAVIDNFGYHVFFISIGLLVSVIGLVVGGWLEDAPDLKPVSESLGETLAYSFRPSVARENKTLYLGLLNFAVFGISIQVFMPYLLIYYEKTLGMDNYVLIFAPAIILAAAFTVFYGRRYDSKGFMSSIVPAMLMLLLGYAVLFFTKTTIPVFIGSLLMMCGYLSGMSVFGALIRDNIPEGRSGQFQGVRIIGQVFIPGLIGPALGARILRDAEVIVNSDGTTSFLPDRGIWSAAAAVLVILLAVLACTFGKGKKKDK